MVCSFYPSVSQLTNIENFKFTCMSTGNYYSCILTIPKSVLYETVVCLNRINLILKKETLDIPSNGTLFLPCWHGTTHVLLMKTISYFSITTAQKIVFVPASWKTFDSLSDLEKKNAINRTKDFLAFHASAFLV